MVVNNPNVAGNLPQSDIDKVSLWANRWLVSFNPQKSESLIFSRKINKPSHPNLFIFNTVIPNVRFHKHLGIVLTDDGSWDNHINQITAKAWKRIHIMRRLKLSLDRQALQIMYFSFIRPILEYGHVIWCNFPQYQMDRLDKIQNEAARITTGCSRFVSISELKNECGWETLADRRFNIELFYFTKCKMA